MKGTVAWFVTLQTFSSLTGASQVFNFDKTYRTKCTAHRLAGTVQYNCTSPDMYCSLVAGIGLLGPLGTLDP
jgi:hypothetical protein